MAPKFISNQRGGYKLIHEGHSYIKHRNRSTAAGEEVTYWRCDQLHRFRCSGFAQTNAISEEVVVTRAHNHAPSSTRIEVLVAKSDIRLAAVNVINATPRAIVANALEGISEAAKHQLPKIANLKKTACRQRKSIGDGVGRGGVTAAEQLPMSSKESLSKSAMAQNNWPNVWDECTVINANTVGASSHRREAVTETTPTATSSSSHYGHSSVSAAVDPPFLQKTSQKGEGNHHCPAIMSAALDVVLKDSLPFGFIERPAIRSLLNAVFELGKMNASPSLSDLLPSQMALRMEMDRRVASMRNSANFKQFIDLLKSGGCFSYAFDESGDGKSIVTIKGHVLNEQFDLLTATLVFKQFSGVTVREPLAMELGQCLNEQLGFSPADLANIHHAIADGTIEVPFENARLGHVCLCDVLNNVLEHTTCPYADSPLHNRRDIVQRLKELNKLIGRIRVIAFWICEHIGDAIPELLSVHLRHFSSDNRRRRFAITVTMLSSFVNKLEEVGTTLRNSCGREAAHLRTEFDEICAHKDELEAYLMATEPIVEWVEFFEESDQPTIHRALPALAGIESGLNTLKMLAMQNYDAWKRSTDGEETVPNSAVLQFELCEAALDALDWNIAPLRGAKAALDPSAWRRELPAVFAKVARWTEEEIIAELRFAFSNAILSESRRRQMQPQHKMPKRTMPTVKRPLFSCSVEMDADGEGEEEERDEVAEYVAFAKQYSSRRVRQPNSNNKFDLFSYWNNDLASVSFSNLRALARQILCVPGGYICGERIFSVQNLKEKFGEEDKFEDIGERDEAEMCSTQNDVLQNNANLSIVPNHFSSSLMPTTENVLLQLPLTSVALSSASSFSSDFEEKWKSQNGTIGGGEGKGQQKIFAASLTLKHGMAEEGDEFGDGRRESNRKRKTSDQSDQQEEKDQQLKDELSDQQG